MPRAATTSMGGLVGGRLLTFLVIWEGKRLQSEAVQGEPQAKHSKLTILAVE